MSNILEDQFNYRPPGSEPVLPDPLANIPVISDFTEALAQNPDINIKTVEEFARFAQAKRFKMDHDNPTNVFSVMDEEEFAVYQKEADESSLYFANLKNPELTKSLLENPPAVIEKLAEKQIVSKDDKGFTLKDMLRETENNEDLDPAELRDFYQWAPLNNPNNPFEHACDMRDLYANGGMNEEGLNSYAVQKANDEVLKLMEKTHAEELLNVNTEDYKLLAAKHQTEILLFNDHLDMDRGIVRSNKKLADAYGNYRAEKEGVQFESEFAPSLNDKPIDNRIAETIAKGKAGIDNFIKEEALKDAQQKEVARLETEKLAQEEVIKSQKERDEKAFLSFYQSVTSPVKGAVVGAFESNKELLPDGLRNFYDHAYEQERKDFQGYDFEKDKSSAFMTTGEYRDFKCARDGVFNINEYERALGISLRLMDKVQTDEFNNATTPEDRKLLKEKHSLEQDYFHNVERKFLDEFAVGKYPLRPEVKFVSDETLDTKFAQYQQHANQPAIQAIRAKYPQQTAAIDGVALPALSNGPEQAPKVQEAKVLELHKPAAQAPAPEVPVKSHQSELSPDTKEPVKAFQMKSPNEAAKQAALMREQRNLGKGRGLG